MREQFDRLTFGLLTIAAVVMAGTFVHREFFARPVAAADVPAKAPEYLREWTELLDDAVFVGQRGAPVTLVEFMDFECPYCRRFNATVRALREKHGDKIAVAV